MGIFDTIEAASDLVIDCPDVESVGVVIEWRGRDILITVELDKEEQTD